MIDDDKTYLQLSLSDIDLGKPLRWPIYNGDRAVIFKKGDVVLTQADAEEAFAKGFYRQVTEGEVLEAKPAHLLKSAILPVADAEPVKPRATGPKSQEYSFSSSKIRVGDALQLQASPDQPRYIVHLIGYLKNRGVIVTPPEVHGEIAMLREGQSFVGRFFSGQSAYAFSTSVLRQTSVPFGHLYLAYPRDLRGVSVRRTSRIEVSIIAAIERDGGGAQSAGKLCNLSITGAGLRTKSRFAEKGDTLCLKFKATALGVDTYLVFNCEVCSVAEDAEDPAMPFLYGLKFLQADHGMQLSLTALIYFKLHEDEIA